MPDKGAVYDLQRDELVVGRLPYCDIVLRQKNVSRQHTRFLRSGDAYFVEDMNSTNGTFLNGKRVRARTQVHDHDVIRVYNVTLLFRESSDEASKEIQAGPSETSAMAESDTASLLADDSAELRKSGRETVKMVRNVGVNAYEKLHTILEINRALGSTLNVDRVLPKILDGLFKVFPQSDRAYILFPDDVSGELVVRAERQKDEGTMSSSVLGPISQTVASRVLTRGEAILNSDGVDDAQLGISDSVLEFPIRSMMCTPIIGPLQKPLGIIYVDTNDPYERFHEDDLEVLLSLSASAGQAVEYAQRHEIQLRLDRRARELAMARQVQLHFLPQVRPDMAGYRFFDYYASAEEVGGDYYGYLPLPDGRLAITLGDVSGKGIWAALVMASLCSEVRYRLVTTDTPKAAVDNLNLEFSKPENEAWFITFVLCVLDPRDHTIELINAGHLPPLRRISATGVVEPLGADRTGPPLGCDASTRYDRFQTKLAPGDVIVMYTDGISEAMNPARELYGELRVSRALKNGSQELAPLCEGLLGEVQAFRDGGPQNDDICLIGVQRDF